MDIAAFKKLPIMGIVRGVPPHAVDPLIDAAAAAGLETIEITMNTPGAEVLIARAAKRAAGRLAVGAGTVLDAAALERALDAGATFIVTPVLVEDVVRHCAAQRTPVFSGALTPGEIYKAWQAGSTMVKVFPSGIFGPAYLKEVKGPFNDIALLACGGVTPENLASYIANGADAVAFGASVFRRDWIESGDFTSIQKRIEAYLCAYRNHRG